jgi:diaminopimelate decarboxylase
MPLQGFTRRAGRLYCEDVPLETIAQEAGSPTYVYSASAIVDNYQAYARALDGLDHQVHFAVKANSSLGVLARLAREGAGFDIVSGGELFRVLRAGGDARKVVFSGVGKTAQEMEYAMESGVGSFNCESADELRLLANVAGRVGAKPSVALRVNPDINAETHPYIATGLRKHKFGVAIDEAEALYLEAAALPTLNVEGVSCHIGSQIFDLQAFVDALARVLELVERLRAAGLTIRTLDLGGGLGVGYAQGESGPAIAEYGSRIQTALAGQELKLMIEPGRSIVGQAGVLLARTLYRKAAGDKVFLIIDAAMNDLIRPALYQSHHEILPVVEAEREKITADVVGPVCETGDFLARNRQMPDVEPGELLAIATAGAYGFVLSSNYNSRPRAAEILVEGSDWRVIRERETLADLVRGEAP